MFDRSRTLARSEAPLDEQGRLGHRLAPLDGRTVVELRRVHAGLVDRLAVDRVDQRLHQRLEGDHLDLVRARVRLRLRVRVMVMVRVRVRVMVRVRVRAISTVEVTPLS